ncbi:Ribonuclease II/R [Forsythia ovata]|uniref:Ribonuclease II/R n=1 Tax=Forsythia ovata TaxID=205694 RepID=A0ABD1W1S4_9LAMI
MARKEAIKWMLKVIAHYGFTAMTAVLSVNYYDRLELKSSEELIENKSGKRMLQKGLLLEFKKDLERVLLAVAQKPGGEKNWMVSDQHAKEAAEDELKEFVKLVKSAKEMSSHSKPAKSSWRTEEKIRHIIESLEAYAIDKHYISSFSLTEAENNLIGFCRVDVFNWAIEEFNQNPIKTDDTNNSSKSNRPQGHRRVGKA